jgi:hypothetical protein
MRKSIFKAAMVVVFAFVAMSAGAQEVKEVAGMKLHTGEWSNDSVKEYLTANPTDTLRVLIATERPDSMTTRYLTKRFYVGQDGRYKVASDTINVSVVYRKTEDLYNQQINSRVVESLYDDKRRDTYYAQVNGLRGVSKEDVNAGKVVLKSVNKYGWSFNFYGGYQISSKLNAPIGGLGVEFTQPRWMIQLNGEYGQSKYTDFAVNAGKRYHTYRTETMIGVKPFNLDRFDQHRLFLFAGLGWEYYSTDSAPIIDGDNIVTITSKGNYLYPTAGLRYEYRMFATGNSWFVEVGWRQLQGVVRDSKPIKNNGVVLKVGFNLGTFRNKVKNVSNKELRALKR